MIRSEVSKLFSLHYLLQKMLPSSPVNESNARALAVLVVLTARDIYDGKLSGDPSCSWFTMDSPADIMRHFERNLPLDEVFSILCNYITYFRMSIDYFRLVGDYWAAAATFLSNF